MVLRLTSLVHDASDGVVKAFESSMNDPVPINHPIAASSFGIIPVGLSPNDTVPMNHPIPPQLFGGIPVGVSASDTMPINTTNHVHALETALTGYDIDVNDPQHQLTGNQADLIRRDMVAAANEWMDNIDNPNHVPINIQINIYDDPKDTHPAHGGPGYVMSTGTGPDATLEPAVEYKLQNGGAADWSWLFNPAPRLSDGAPADVVININAHDLDGEWLDPNPGTGSAGLPDDKVDMVSILAHEFGHGLGIGDTRSLDTATGTFNGSEKSTWESLLDIEKSGTTFTGSHAEQEHGGPVVVTTDNSDENYQHFGNTLSDLFDRKHGWHPEMMNGLMLAAGVNYTVSPLDLAVLQDLGYKTKGAIDPTNIIEVAHPTYFDTHSLGSTLPAKIAFLAANHADAAGLASVTHTGDTVFTNTFAHAVANATHAIASVAGDTSPTHAGVLYSDLSNALVHAVGATSPSHAGTVLTDVINTAAHEISNAVGTLGTSHTGNVLTDVLGQAAHAVLTAAGAATSAHSGGITGDTGNFWNHVADAVHQATGNAGSLLHALTNAPADTAGVQQTIGTVLHSAGIAGMLGHMPDAIHVGGEIAHIVHENHTLPQFELPTLHLSEWVH